MPKKIEDRIERFFHCLNCMTLKPNGQTPKEWARLEAGYTSRGHIKINCVRCNLEIVSIQDGLAPVIN